MNKDNKGIVKQIMAQTLESMKIKKEPGIKSEYLA